uniref:Uncharacterized protein n=1 Tax=Romanomermis culicivorax TaxID=13658 RepID=A0A915ISU2_ROMCU
MLPQIVNFTSSKKSNLEDAWCQVTKFRKNDNLWGKILNSRKVLGMILIAKKNLESRPKKCGLVEIGRSKSRNFSAFHADHNVIVYVPGKASKASAAPPTTITTALPFVL